MRRVPELAALSSIGSLLVGGLPSVDVRPPSDASFWFAGNLVVVFITSEQRRVTDIVCDGA